MSRRTAEASKAIKKAWEREQDLVREGKGTRDWTKEQQADILNPDKGKAFDDKGRAFEGQHMKSVGKYPEYQGNPDNIQFLTKEEHLDAHKGSWQNPTNWWYDPKTKEFFTFGEEELIPCPTIELSKPVVPPKTDPVKESVSKPHDSETARDRIRRSEKKTNVPPLENIKTPEPPNIGRKLLGGLKTAGKFVIEHPWESAGAVYGFFKTIGSLSHSGDDSSNDSYTSNTSFPDKTDTISRTSPSENDVSAHRQRYHTKEGTVWKDKEPYHRGGKDR